MKLIYSALVLLVLYGDLLKRVLSPSIALLTLYAVAMVILAVVAVSGGRETPRMSREGRVAHFAVSCLILLYLSQLVTSFSSPFMQGMSHAMYMCIPLAYIWVLQKYCKEFDLAALGRWFFIYMIPINAVGLIQYYVDPDFLISTAYSEEGGIIIRDFLDGGGAKAFARYPSIFASADRYSAMGLMHLYFAMIVLKDNERPSSRLKLWLFFNVVGSIAALFIAGARSRILISSASAIAMAITFIIATMFSRKHQAATPALALAVPLFAVVFLLYFALAPELPVEMPIEEAFPVVTFLFQSAEHDDFTRRTEEAVEMSIVPKEITFFGQGLGTVWDGKPGEFGIWSIWTESGLVWGSLIIIAFLFFIKALLVATLKSFLAMSPLNVAIRFTALLLIIFALLAGLTSSFELSSGLLLACIVAATLRASGNVKARGSASMAN